MQSDVSWPGAREQVLALREAPFPRRAFGAGGSSSGPVRLDRPLSEAEVAAAERELGVSFPPSYRTFLLEVGAGGTGPHYGLFSLRRDKRGWHWADEFGFRHDSSLLDRPFPSMEERAHWEEDFDAREPDRKDFPDEQSYRRAFTAWDDEWDTLREEMIAGAICLSSQGCGTYTWLAVTGPERGTVWSVSWEAEVPVSPCSAGTDSVDFHDWYVSWLARITFQAYGGAPGERRLRPPAGRARPRGRLARWFGR
ncbi:SMI1/KNR4 family protein [Kitasatospora sp. NPDC048365]|uniref:SMI1/KNR4 family protein n=1 Tax=Kitasatospora sp. NPDC048365 TaxID=3364050 RepID=UPI00371F4084